MHPEVLKDYSKKERVSKIRTKIINMRRQKRKELELDFKELTTTNDVKRVKIMSHVL